MNRRSLLAIFGGVAIAATIGCGRSNSSAETESSNLKPLAVYYGRFVGANRGKGPKDENQLKEFIRNRPADELSTMGITDVDSLFISSRDKKPYKFKFEEKQPMPGQLSIFAWEQDGVNGKRFVGGTLGQIEEVDEARFRELVPNP